MTVNINPRLGVRASTPYILAKSNVPATRNSANVAGDATSAVLATVTIPANLLSGNTSAYVFALWRVTSSANVKTLSAKLGGTSIGNLSPTTNVANHAGIFIHADNSASDQKIPNGASIGMAGVAGTMLDYAKDCSVPIDLSFECNWAGAIASETITLESYMIWVFPG